MKKTALAIGSAYLLSACSPVEPGPVELEEIGYFVAKDFIGETLPLIGVRFSRDEMRQVPTGDTLYMTGARPYLETIPGALNGADLWYKHGDCYFTRVSESKGLGCLPITD